MPDNPLPVFENYKNHVPTFCVGIDYSKDLVKLSRFVSVAPTVCVKEIIYA